jgi:hypothetical protein
MPKRLLADLSRKGGGCMGELFSMVEPVSLEERPACGRLCHNHALEARLIQFSLLPTQGLRHACVEIEFRFMPFSDVGGALPISFNWRTA